MVDRIKYIFTKLWLLILLLIISCIVVINQMTGSTIFDFLNSFFFFALYVLGIGILAHFFGEALPRNYCCEKGFFSCHAWEDEGNFYDHVFHVKKWKDHSFDLSKAFGDVQTKKPGMQRDPEVYQMILQETCAAEITHWMLILFSPLMLLIVTKTGRFLLLICYITANLGDIIIQRYNRPRMFKVYQKLVKRQSGTI